jgi:hypothetical protein
LRCRSCGKKYRLEAFAEAMDEAFEAQLAGISCDRL